MLIAQITDCHVTARGRLAMGEIDTPAALRRTVAFLNALTPRPDLVVITGDLINGPQPGEYEMAAELLADLALPCLMIPGNHDSRDGMRSAFAATGAVPAEGQFLHQSRRLGPLHLLALDTHLPGRTEGGLCEERLAWIARRLEEAGDTPTLVLMHHPPFVSGIVGMDRIMCGGADRLAELLRGRPIAGILCGHVHRAITAPFAGTTAFCAPSAAFQLALTLGDLPLAWTREPPAMAMHLWDPAHGLRNHVAPIGDFPPTPFR
ncbi:phosphodiesterase [Indioceanicola profundi]|uniref:phosphodiesterase n=1 Tax=Indioceanicola profundi TaxID=2220096 RepID=UPI000E6AB1E5|nr:phosphodiesterase [Indioceanicola profundi]